MLEGAGDLKRKWTWSVEWLHDELERGGGHRASYASTAGRISISGKYNAAHCLISQGLMKLQMDISLREVILLG